MNNESIITPKKHYNPINVISELWDFRDLLGMFALRDLKIRYKQTFLGLAWVVLQPLLSTGIFTVVFGAVFSSYSNNVSYSMFAFSGLLLWQPFARVLSEGSICLGANHGLITKVYFPRIILPLIPVVGALADFCVTGVLFLAIAIYSGAITFSWSLLLLPLFPLAAVTTALSFSLWFCALDAIYRDVRYIMGFVVQIWLFATPIIYPISIVPKAWKFLYALNPMSNIVTAFRWVVFAEPAPDVTLLLISFMSMAMVLISGLYFFKNVEQTLVDKL